MPPKHKKAGAKAAPVAEVVVGPGEAFKNVGNERFKIGDFVGAVEQYTLAIEADPAQIVYYSNRSASYAAYGTVKGSKNALADAEKCIELDATWSKGYYRKGMALQGLGLFPAARKALEEGQRLNPTNEEFSAALESLAKMGVGLADGDEVAGGGSAGASAGSGEGEGESTLSLGSLTGALVELEEEEDKFEALERWLKENGAVFPLLYMKRYSENYRGVHIRTTTGKDQELMSIPQRCLITVEMGEACPIGAKMKMHNLDLSARKHCFVAVFVLWDRRNPASFFQPYYRILPTSYPNMPIFWSEEELSWLEGSYILTQIADRKRNIKADYEDICRVAPEFKDFSLEEFSWARMMVASRNFGITIGEVKTDALVPLADMLNHYRPRETKWQFENAANAFTITSLERLSAGHQVFDSYGKKCNSRFLLNYGFAVEVNRDADGQCHNEVRIMLSLRSPADDKHREAKVRLLNGSSTSRGVRISTWYEHESTQEAFSFLRFSFAQNREVMLLPVLGDDYDLGKKPIKPISWVNEVLVLEELARLMVAQLARYPSTLEEDIAVLEAGTYPFQSNRRNAIVIIKGEKEVCHHYIALAETAVRLFHMDYSEAKKVIAKSHKTRSDINDYIAAVVVPLLKLKATTRTSGTLGASTSELALLGK